MRLSTNESELLVEIWSTLKNHIANKDRNDAAEEFVQTLLNGSIDMDNVYEEFYGPMHLETLRSVSNVAVLLHGLGKFDE